MHLNKDRIRTFEDLEVWMACREVRNRIAALVRRFPAEERYRLGDQLIRAARSVTANIAEGYGRFYYQENIQFCRQVRGSLYEILDHLTVACDESYLTEEEFKTYRDEMTRALSLLNGYIRYLKSAKFTAESDV